MLDALLKCRVTSGLCIGGRSGVWSWFLFAAFQLLTADPTLFCTSESGGALGANSASSVSSL